MKVTEDGFVFKVVTEKAKEIWSCGLFELYVLRDDGSQSLIETFEELDNCLENGFVIGIEVGRVSENKAFVSLVEQMRSNQKEYFRTRNKEVLDRSKMLESSVDKFIISVKNNQEKLF